MNKRLLIKFFLFFLLLDIHQSWAQSYTHWSIQGVGGATAAWKADNKLNYKPSFGGNVEYTFNPFVGVGAGYLYQNNSYAAYAAKLHHAGVFVSVNLSNWWAPNRADGWKNLNAYLNMGGALGAGRWSQSSTGNSGDLTTLSSKLTLNVEYNVCKAIALGVDAGYGWMFYRNYSEVDGQLYTPGRDRNFYALNLSLRYKICCSSKPHIRNIMASEYKAAGAGADTVNAGLKPAPKTKMQELLEEQARMEPVKRKNKAIADSIFKADSLKWSTNNTSADPVGRALGLTTQGERKAAEAASDNNKAESPVSQSTLPVPIKAEVFATHDLKCYSVVVGSFANKSGAQFWYNVLKKEHYPAQIVVNEAGMFRVIILTTDDLKAAVATVRKIVKRFPGSWLLITK